jgi:hypothetical protein
MGEKLMKNYKNWLYLTCKWATIGLDQNEFDTWQLHTTELNKHCPDCEVGQVCESCRESGLKLTGIEELMLDNIDKTLKIHREHAIM